MNCCCFLLIRKKMFIHLNSIIIVAVLVAVTMIMPSVAVHIADMCEHEMVQSAAHLVFEDRIERYFISNGNYYWLVDVANEIPNEQNAQRIPYDFIPDVALLRDTTECKNGYRSLFLIQMKHRPETNEAEWLTLEMRIGRWNGSVPYFWRDIHKIAHCNLRTETCSTTDPNFTTMNFDFKRKLDSAFGTIGHTAYFLQGQKAYKVHYRKQCIRNPYGEVVAYSGTPIGTTTTAALAEESKNVTVILFDRDVHYRIAAKSLEKVPFVPEVLGEPSNWRDNNQEFFRQCQYNTGLLAMNLLIQDMFSGSKRHYYLRRTVLICLSLIFVTLIALSIYLFVVGLRNRRTKPNQDDGNGVERNGSVRQGDKDRMIENKSATTVTGSTDAGGDGLLQTTC